MGRVAIYCRVSTADQSCARQERDLREYTARAGMEVIDVFKETASGAKDNRPERKKVLALAQARKIDAVLVTELSRWGRSTQDLGRRHGQRPSDKKAARVLKLHEEGLSYRLIARNVGLSKNTIMQIVRRGHPLELGRGPEPSLRLPELTLAAE